MSMGRFRFAVVVTLSLILAACGEDLAGPVDLEDTSLDFVVRVLGYNDPDPSLVSGGPGTIGVWRSLRTGMCGYEVTGSLSQGPGGLDLHIKAEHTTGIAVPCHYRYEAIIRGLPPGLHRFRILHRVDGSDAVVFSDKVRVD